MAGVVVALIVVAGAITTLRLAGNDDTDTKDSAANGTDDAAGGAGAERRAAVGWKRVEAGYDFTCGVRTDGTAWCSQPPANGAGEPDGKAAPGTASVQVPGDNWETISTSQDPICGLKTDKSLWCWGTEQHVVMGLGSSTEEYVPDPVQLAPDLEWDIVETGDAGGCAITVDADLYCWGINYSGEVGVGSVTEVAKPTPVAPGMSWASVSMGSGSTCAMTTDAELFCWGGYDQSNEEFDGPNSLEPELVSTLTDPSTPPGGSAGVCGTTDERPMLCAGPNAFFNDDGVYDIGRAGEWKSFSVGDYTVCAIDTSDALYCAGENGNGELGDGTLVDSAELVQVTEQSETWSSVSAGNGYTCAVATDGRAWCWGVSSRSHDEVPAEKLLDTAAFRELTVG